MAKSRKEAVEPGAITRHCSEAEARALATQWLSVFGTDRQGVNAKAFLWHIFSAGRYPSVTGDEAWTQYTRQEAAEFIVLSNDRTRAFVTDARRVTCRWTDCYVFPPNLARTMARTHEEGWLGAYFARHARLSELDVENIAAVQKQREIAAAKLKGWA